MKDDVIAKTVEGFETEDSSGDSEEKGRERAERCEYLVLFVECVSFVVGCCCK